MSVSVLAIVASVAVDDGGIGLALDDGTVWIVRDGEWEEIGACPDGEVTELATGDDELAITCGDGARWRWSESDGWIAQERSVEIATDDEIAIPIRSWWPQLELTARATREPPIYEGWIRLSWDL